MFSILLFEESYTERMRNLLGRAVMLYSAKDYVVTVISVGVRSNYRPFFSFDVRLRTPAMSLAI